MDENQESAPDPLAPVFQKAAVGVVSAMAGAAFGPAGVVAAALVGPFAVHAVDSSSGADTSPALSRVSRGLGCPNVWRSGWSGSEPPPRPPSRNLNSPKEKLMRARRQLRRARLTRFGDHRLSHTRGLGCGGS
jgi:hypothetical protein